MSARTCARCGALKADHIDYGRGSLLCPTTEGGTFSAGARAFWSAKQIAAMTDELLIEELLVSLALELDVTPLTRAVIQRGLIEQASALAIERTSAERRRLGREACPECERSHGPHYAGPCNH